MNRTDRILIAAMMFVLAIIFLAISRVTSQNRNRIDVLEMRLQKLESNQKLIQ